MKNVAWIAFVFGFATLRGEVVRVRVTDDDARPIAGAQVRVIFGATLADGTRDVTVPFLTDQRGTGVARGRAEFRTSVFLSKPGFYDVRVDGLRAGQDHDLALVLRERKNPISLYVARVGSDRVEWFPKRGVWLGFDFSAADWIAPYGKGKSEDIRFRFQNVFRDYDERVKENLADSMMRNKRAYIARGEEWTEEKYKLEFGKWDAVLEVSFPGEQDGLIEETLRYLPYNEMRLPHEAPSEGYVPTWRTETNSYGPPQRRENVGFFLRTHTKLDSRGNIVSAHYAKLTGDIEVDARGSIRFHCYFNPVANDRNLEFDYERNLFPKDMVGARNVPLRP
ncbi:MAG: carboxypeptidase-like regulatory domain-containing protein [Opitutaceae bacterium]|nr:carboxypeptidase-like regulatory domain-containing protein [Opitutaceae bacterium]